MKLRSALLAAAGLATTVPAHAQAPTAPIEVELSYDGDLNALHLTGDWKVLTLHIVERASPSDFSTAGQMNTYGLLHALIHLDLRTSALGWVKDGHLLPHVFEFAKLGKWGVKRTTLVWGPDDVAVTPPPHHHGDTAPTKAQKLEAADPLTLFSRVVYAPSAEALCARNWRFFDGSELYELRFQPGAPASLSDHDRAMGFTSAVRCQVRYAEIAGFVHKRGESHDEGLKSDIHAQFGRLGATGPWLFLSMKADTLLGYAKVELREVKLSQP